VKLGLVPLALSGALHASLLAALIVGSSDETALPTAAIEVEIVAFNPEAMLPGSPETTPQPHAIIAPQALKHQAFNHRASRFEKPEDEAVPAENNLSAEPTADAAADPAPSFPPSPMGERRKSQAAAPALSDGGGPSLSDGNPLPVYPIIARRRGLEGQTLLKVEVSATGSANVSLVRSSGHEVLDSSALAAVKDWRFRPATKNGVSVAGELAVPVTFRLTE
jgi:protein TonB